MIDLERIRKHSPQDGDVFELPADTSPQLAGQFAEALHVAVPGVRCLVLIGTVNQVDEAAMNLAGWYRQ
ncbi:hypothetical protein [Stutzerimonas stutzeri]|uniref:Uncharacterized protein n=1 Tax=Stutzerimonas stutzeri TaxID=316 RepID=A0A6I6LSV9_STUST|nr:hypothetical protein [Stutzerimonas stutzeri]QGZ31496.1 hypothetical protein GQA94_16015 [Stutzerimonas stutzeri]